MTDRESARVPSGFFKVICFDKANDSGDTELGVLTFAIFQNEKVLRDKRGAASVKTDMRYQITISELQEWTGIKFDESLYHANPLFFDNKVDRNAEHNVPQCPERIPIGTETDVVIDGGERRNGRELLQERRIIINSALIDPPGSDKGNEWVSLHNRSLNPVTMSNWSLIDGQNRSASVSGRIAPGESLILKGRNLGKVKLPNSGGNLMLYDGRGGLVDHVTWSKNDLKKIDKNLAYCFERGQ